MEKRGQPKLIIYGSSISNPGTLYAPFNGEEYSWSSRGLAPLRPLRGPLTVDSQPPIKQQKPALFIANTHGEQKKTF